jgi:pre-mRNA-splicing factor ISY1
LFVCVAAPAPKKSRGELYKDVDADYYGYRDEDDGVILPLEKEAEQKGEIGCLPMHPWNKTPVMY